MSLNQLKTKLEQARQQYYDADAKMRQAETDYNEAVAQDNNSMKEKLREKWKEVNKKDD